MAVTVADLMVKLGMDDSNFQRGTEAAHSHTSRFGAILKTGMVAVGAAAAAGLATGFSAIKTMEDAMTPIGTLLGTTTPEFHAMKGAIEGVIKSSPKSPEELGGAAYTILSAGITDATKAQQALKDANALSLAGLGSVPEATDLITSAMNSWKDANLSSTDAAKILFGTIASGKTTTSQLAQGFGQIAPLAASAGINMTELMAATAGLTATGQPASVAYSGLRAAISNILSPTAEASDMAKKMGVDFSSGALKTKGLAGFLDMLKGGLANAATQGISSTDAMAGLFGSVEAMNAVLTLTGPQADAFTNNLTGIAKSGENLDARAKEVSNTLSNRLAAAKNRALVTFAEYGTKGLNWLTGMWEKHRDTVIPIIDTVKEWVRQLGLGIAAFFQASRDNGVTSDGFVGFMERMKLVALDLVDWWKANWPAIRDTTVQVFEALMAVGNFLVEQWRIIWPEVQAIVSGVVSSLQERLSVIMTVIGDVVAFVQLHWPEIQAAIQPVLDTIVQLVGAAFELIKAYFDLQTKVIRVIWDAFGEHIMSVVLWVVTTVAPIIQGLLDAIISIIRVFSSILKGDWSEAWSALGGIFIGIWHAFLGLFSGAMDLLKNVFGVVWDIGASIIDNIMGGVQNKFSGLYSWFSNLPYEIYTAVRNIGAWTKGIGEDIIWGFINGIRAMAGRLWDEAWSAVTGPIKAIGGWLHLGSPSKLMRDWGRWTMQGYALGMEGESRHLSASAASSFQGVTQAASDVRTTTQTNVGGTVGPVTVVMPPGSNGDDVVRALRSWQDRNGALPIRVGV